MMNQYLDAIVRHYAASWSEPTKNFRWRKGPIETLRPEFRVLRISRSNGTVAFATLGMSDPNDVAPLELHLLAKPDLDDEDQNSVVELLASVAHYHLTGQTLDMGHSVDFGRGWVKHSPCSCGLVSLPYFDGPTLEWMENPRVRFLWLIPIMPIERELKRTNGLEILEQRFEREQVDLLDPMRRAVA